MGQSQDEFGSRDDALVVGQLRLSSDTVFRAGYCSYCPGETWKPHLNIYEDDRNYYVVANLAGTGTQAIDLECRDGQLILSGHRPTPPPPEVHGKLKLIHMEIDHGRFTRVLELPGDVDPDGIEAIYRTGQLLVTLPKRT
ncbi:MAG: Hsp20/alpha crystallin family protein [Phycisphaerae bacterium]|nr:Hsp20/alpha crystallin family protein [Phycisphaerae bacterium]